MSRLLVKGGRVVDPSQGIDAALDVLLADGAVEKLGARLAAKGAEVVDAYESGVLDVTEVLKTVLQTAASGALMALTTDTIVYHKNPEQAVTP